jgi:hypothetical protein
MPARRSDPRRLVHRELNTGVSVRIVVTGSGGHLLFDHRIWVAGNDRLGGPPASAHDAIGGWDVAVLLVYINHACLVVRLAAATEDPNVAEIVVRGGRRMMGDRAWLMSSITLLGCGRIQAGSRS